MSQLLRAVMLMRRQQVTGTLSGTSTLAIPANVTLVTLTGAGGTGGNNYDPGQAYIAPSGYTAYWSGGTWGFTSSTLAYNVGHDPGWPTTYAFNGTSCDGSANGATTTVYEELNRGDGTWDVYNMTYTASGATYHASTYDPGQAYIAPSGGDTYGPNTTATLNSMTRTWTGGLGAVVGNSSIQTLASTGAGQTLSYSVGAGGNLSYSY